MAIKNYKNYDDIKETSTKTTGDYLDKKTAALVEVGVEFPHDSFGGSDDNIEFHAYTVEDNELGSKFEGVHFELSDKSGSDGGAVLNLKPAEELKELGFTLGRYKYVYNIYQRLTHNNCYIHTISPSRTEALIFPVKTRNWYNDFKTNLEFTHFGNKVNIGANVGFEMFDVNQDGTVNILDIVQGLNVGLETGITGSTNPDEPGFGYPEGLPIKETITPSEAMIMVDFILGYNSGAGSPGNYIGNTEAGNEASALATKLTIEQLEENGFPQDKLQSLNPQGGTNEQAWLHLANKVLRNYQQFDQLDPEKLDVYANFGENKFSLLTNWVLDDRTYPEAPHGIVLKFLEPLPEDVTERTQLSLCQFYGNPVIDKISLVGTPLSQRKLNILAPHNKKIDVNLKTNHMGQFESWEQILGHNPTTQQNLIDFYLSGSHLEQRINIDYTDYRNFVKFGSAYERLANFKYKLEKIELYDSKSDAHSLVSGSGGTVSYYKELKRDLISGFDNYEKFMYYESGSYISESGLGAVGTVDYQDATSPKQNSTKPYRLYSTTSSNFTTWYSNQSSNALNHDNFNEDSLQDNVPMHLKMGNENAEYLLFLNMMGQHFDTVWTYAKHMTDVSDRSHNINSLYNFDPNTPGTQNYEGLDKGLTYFVAQAHGLKLNNGQDLVKLWKYALGENQFNEGTITLDGNKISIQDGAFSNDLEDGTLYIPSTENPSGSQFETTLTDIYHSSASISPSYSGVMSSSNYTITYDIEGSENTSLSSNDYTKEIWRRLLNNLPYLLKTKGTARSVKALISCYGIPQTILQIQEYGGPTKVGNQIYTLEKFGYGLHYTGSNQYAQLHWKPTTKTSRNPDTLQFRFAFDVDMNSHNWDITTSTGLFSGMATHNEKDNNSVRLATLGGGATGSALWDIRANPLTGSLYHDMGKGTGTSTLPQQYGLSGKGQYNTISSSVTEWGFLTFNLSGSTGYKTLYSDPLPIYNKDFWQVTLQRTSGSDSTNIDQTYELYVKQAVGDRVSFSSYSTMSFTGATSASYKSNFTSSDTLWLTDSGSDIGGGWFSGSISEVRLWNKPLTEKIINMHTKAPYSYAGGSTSSYYDNLEVRFPFNTIYEFETAGVATPNVYSSSNVANITTYQTTASLINFGTTNKSMKEFEIENNFELPNIGANRLTSNKIRVENAVLDGNLNTKIRSEKRANDYAPIDSPKLDVYFSPVKPINEDIIADFSGLELDDLLGDPEDIYKDKYTALENAKKLYFQRYDNLNNFFDYIRLIQMYDSTLFDHIKSLIPHRAHESVGLLIEPHLLERSKFSGWKKLVKDETHFRNQEKSGIPGQPNIAIDYYDRGASATASTAGSFRYNSGSVDMGTDKMEGFADLYNDFFGGQPFNDTITLGNSLNVDIQKTASLDAPTVDDYSPVFRTEFITSASQVTSLNVGLEYQLTSSGNVEDGLQNTSITTYLADIKKMTQSHESSSYHWGAGGAANAQNEDWFGNPEKECYHPFVHKHILSDTYLIHSSSAYECIQTDGTVASKPMVPYGYWDNDRSITGSIDPVMASRGFLPAECSPPDTIAYRTQKYIGTKNKISTTYDGKDAFEVHETSPSVLVVSDTSPNTLQVQ